MVEELDAIYAQHGNKLNNPNYRCARIVKAIENRSIEIYNNAEALLAGQAISDRNFNARQLAGNLVAIAQTLGFEYPKFNHLPAGAEVVETDTVISQQDDDFYYNNNSGAVLDVDSLSNEIIGFSILMENTKNGLDKAKANNSENAFNALAIENVNTMKVIKQDQQVEVALGVLEQDLDAIKTLTTVQSLNNVEYQDFLEYKSNFDLLRYHYENLPKETKFNFKGRFQEISQTIEKIEMEDSLSEFEEFFTQLEEDVENNRVTEREFYKRFVKFKGKFLKCYDYYKSKPKSLEIDNRFSNLFRTFDKRVALPKKFKFDEYASAFHTGQDTVKQRTNAKRIRRENKARQEVHKGIDAYRPGEF